MVIPSSMPPPTNGRRRPLGKNAKKKKPGSIRSLRGKRVIPKLFKAGQPSAPTFANATSYNIPKSSNGDTQTSSYSSDIQVDRIESAECPPGDSVEDNAEKSSGVKEPQEIEKPTPKLEVRQPGG